MKITYEIKIPLNETSTRAEPEQISKKLHVQYRAEIIATGGAENNTAEPLNYLIKCELFEGYILIFSIFCVFQDLSLNQL